MSDVMNRRYEYPQSVALNIITIAYEHDYCGLPLPASGNSPPRLPRHQGCSSASTKFSRMDTWWNAESFSISWSLLPVLITSASSTCHLRLLAVVYSFTIYSLKDTCERLNFEFSCVPAVNLPLRNNFLWSPPWHGWRSVAISRCTMNGVLSLQYTVYSTASSKQMRANNFKYKAYLFLSYRNINSAFRIFQSCTDDLL